MGKKRARHITLIGMPSAGKTKVGNRLARLLGRDFVDIDDEIKKYCSVDDLQQLVDNLTAEEFARLENEVAISTVRNLTELTIIATGGSVIYCREAMKILRKETFVIYLHASYETIARRIERRSKRSSNGGIVFGKHKNLKGLYRFRTRLYGKSAHMKFSTDGHRSVAAHRLAKKLQRSGIA